MQSHIEHSFIYCALFFPYYYNALNYCIANFFRSNSIIIMYVYAIYSIMVENCFILGTNQNTKVNSETNYKIVIGYSKVALCLPKRPTRVERPIEYFFSGLRS